MSILLRNPKNWPTPEFFRAGRPAEMGRMSLTARNTKGQTLLHCAAAAGNGDLTEWLCAQGANPKAKDWQWKTPLHAAAESRNGVSSLTILLNAGSPHYARDRNGMTPLHQACAKSQDGKPAEILLDRGAAIESRTHRGETPLHRAAGQNPHTATTAILLRQGADREAADKKGETPLFAAARSEHGENHLRLLLDQGANPWARNQKNHTPADAAEAAGQERNQAILEEAQITYAQLWPERMKGPEKPAWWKAAEWSDTLSWLAAGVAVGTLGTCT